MQRLSTNPPAAMLRQIERLRCADQNPPAKCSAGTSAALVLLAVEPGDEQHLHRAAAIPVALLVVGADASHARAEAFRDHRRQRRIALRRHAQLPFRRRRTADGADLPVRPGLRRHPVDRVVAVRERRAENVVIAFGEEVSALIHLDIGVAALHRVEFGASYRAARPSPTSQ